jgi:hypothetical protein
MYFSSIYNVGRVAEWFKAPVLKTGRGFTPPREFESHPFRQPSVFDRAGATNPRVSDNSQSQRQHPRGSEALL